MQTIQIYKSTDHTVLGTLVDSDGDPVTTSTAVLSIYDKTDTLVDSAITASQSSGVYTFTIPDNLGVSVDERYYGHVVVTDALNNIDTYKCEITVEYRT